jgi:cell division inhibitor SepF
MAEWAGIVQPSRYDEDDFGPEDEVAEATETTEAVFTPPPTPVAVAGGTSERQGIVTPIDQHRTRRQSALAREAVMDEIVHVRPRSYGSDATRIAESYRENIPVIMNMSDLDDAEAFRLIDFASGLKFALDGHLEKITSRVFLLTPPSVKVTDRDKERIAGGLVAQA